VHQALQDARLDRAAWGELLVVLQPLLRQLEDAFTPDIVNVGIRPANPS
jgi:diadenosine tetraphosphate (Ap4A) HIT family hydrolase